jgi:hypothetical protein
MGGFWSMRGLDQIDGVQSARLAKALWKNERRKKDEIPVGTPPPPSPTHYSSHSLNSSRFPSRRKPTNPDLEILQQSLKNKTKLRCILITKNQSLRFLFITGLYHLAAAKRLGWIGPTGPAC